MAEHYYWDLIAHLSAQPNSKCYEKVFQCLIVIQIMLNVIFLMTWMLVHEKCFPKLYIFLNILFILKFCLT